MGCEADEGRAIPIGVRVLPAGTTAVWSVGGAGLDDEEKGAPVSLLSCHRTQTRSSLHSLVSSSGREPSAMKMSDNTPVGMSHMNVSRFFILETAKATNVPSILPLSLLIMYSATQSFGPFPNENLRVCCA